MANTMNAYRKPQQYIYHGHHCQLGYMARGHTILVSVCIFMLPMLSLAAEHVQLTNIHHINTIKQWDVHPGHMVFIHTPLVLPTLSNVLPALVLHSSLVRSSIRCPAYTSSCSSVCCVPLSQCLYLPFCLGRRMVVMVLALLLLLSGDIETNPGPAGQSFFFFLFLA